jgi:hypothetical protein
MTPQVLLLLVPTERFYKASKRYSQARRKPQEMPDCYVFKQDECQLSGLWWLFSRSGGKEASLPGYLRVWRKFLSAW